MKHNTVGCRLPWQEERPQTKQYGNMDDRALYYKDPKTLSNHDLLTFCSCGGGKGACLDCAGLLTCKWGMEIMDRLDDGRMPPPKPRGGNRKKKKEE